ncbi:amidohydrolase [Halalkalibacter krulwichiae]|uniref:N-substituted formamide deformylase n=1 Tax=Halalkalibacter krulwichiae TaxID=199441 RepID=A0A1X9MJM2_9BACI|nr:amidohydrolase [Halalkalibacter krulwichiae]ARK31841.1 N-substituted formamide deformylase precursor [Halalkalibacter krulwichiae]
MVKEELLFMNGKIFTSNSNQPYASAMRVRDGKIVWIGELEDLEQREQCIDLKGKRVIPGLIDAHLHPVYLAKAEKQIACTPPLVESIVDIVSEIKKMSAKKKAGAWIECWGYDEGKLQEGRAPLRWDLDQATTEHPVIVTRTCAHVVSVNSVTLELAGITKDTPNPAGGQIDRDQEGEPTGILRENAKDLLANIMPVETLDDQAQLLAELSPKLLSKGITAITDLMAKSKPINYFDLYQEARKRGLKQRTVLYYLYEELKKGYKLDGEQTNREQPIHIGGVKLFSDGSVSGQTAWVTPSFMGEEEAYGIQMTSEEELLAAAKVAKEQGIQLVIHAMGEQAIDLIVNTFYEKEGWLKGAPSIRIEHASLPTKKAIERAAKAGIAIVTQPIFLYAEIESYLNNLGEERTKNSYPIQSLLKAGVPVAFSSDAPATAWADPANLFVGMKAAITRLAYDRTDTGQSQRVAVETAVKLFTSAAQHITRIPEIGQLAPGYQADFIVLDQDLLEIDPEKIDEIMVEQTYLAGELVYEKNKILQQ